MRFELRDDDVGNVKLDLKADHTFDLGVEILITAQIEIEGDESGEVEGVNENYTGSWKVQDSRILLTFSGDPDLPKLFNPNLDPYHTTRIIDEKTVSFEENIERITIRGVYCDKL